MNLCVLLTNVYTAIHKCLDFATFVPQPSSVRG